MQHNTIILQEQEVVYKHSSKEKNLLKFLELKVKSGNNKGNHSSI
jgi:hypothetical protein